MAEELQQIVSGDGWASWQPFIYQYRAAYGVGDYVQPLNESKHGYPTPSSNVRQMVYSGINTWNTSGYDYSAYANILRREPLHHQEPSVILNYFQRNGSGPDPVAVTPIAIAQYALSTGMIYVGGNSGNWGGIQTGMIAQGGYNAY